MCGIFGVLGDVPTLDMSEDVISSCLDTIAHRGPDARGIAKFSSEHSSGFLGHVRLAIIDLSGGRQPMASEDGNLLLSFNGEIYNYLILKEELLEKGYHFRDSSDTEVLLNAYREWGVDCLGKLRGMFAFAIWDTAKGSLIIARDQFGKKPIFYTEKNGLFFFASEIKALQAIPNTTYSFNKAQLKNYLIYRYVPSPETFIDEIKKLPAGSYMECRNGEKTIVSFFKPAEAAPARNLLDRPSAVAQFLQILSESVRLRMAADVPYGAFLSGGIDSSAIVALMSEHSSKTVKTFSVGFNNTEYSELGSARLIADHFGTDHHEVVVSQDDLIQLLPEVIAYRDAPVCEPSDIPIYLLAKEARKTVKMVLTGEGSDEILGGYSKHFFERLAAPYQKVPRLIRTGLIAPLIDALPYRYHRAKIAIRNLNTEDFNERMPGWFGAMSERQAEDLLNVSGQSPLPNWARANGSGKLHDVLLFDQLSWLPDNLLERGDRMTMAASIEARMPFMDVELAKFAASLPDNYRINGFVSKWILRQAMQTMLPREILERPKLGFRVPVNIWFRTTMKDFLCENLLGSNSISKRFYHEEVLNRLLKEHINGDQNHEKVLWMLLNLEIWLQQNQHRILM